MISHAFSALVKAPAVCGRVAAHNRSSYFIETDQGDVRAQLLGSLRHEITNPADLPVVGDYVSLSIAGGTAMIQAVLPRTNLFARRGIDGSHQLQPIAANLDMLFVTIAVNRDFNLRRLERYVVAAAGFGVPFAVLLTKIDLVAQPDPFIASVEDLLGETPVLAVCAIEQRGFEQLEQFRGPNRTLAFVGSSGVGKSTLVNALLGKEVMAVREILSEDDRGRHTTTRRVLLHLDDGTAIIDTPGMREFALADANEGVNVAFQEVADLAAACRFHDCRHETEPGCAVRQSVDQARLASWRKLEREAAFEARKHDYRAAAIEKERWKQIHKANRRRKDEY